MGANRVTGHGGLVEQLDGLHPAFFDTVGDADLHVAAGQQDGMCDPLVDQDLRGPDDLLVLSLGENDPLRLATSPVEDAVS